MMKPPTRFAMRPALAALVIALELCPNVALADGPSTPSRDQYDQATTLYSNQRYDEAKKLLLELWAKSKTHDVATMLGQIEKKLGHWADATRYLTFAVANYPPTEEVKRLESIRASLTEAQKHVMTYDVKVNVDGATITVDGAESESKLFLEPGMHLIFVRKTGFRSADRRLEARAGATDTWEVTLQPSDSAPAANPGAVKVEPFGTEPPKDTISSKPNPWILVGGGVVTAGALVTGLVLNSKAKSASDDAHQLSNTITPGACIDPSVSVSSDCSAIVDSADRSDKFRTYSTIGFVVSGVAAVGTLAYWLWPRQKSKVSAQRFVIDGGFGRDTGALRVTTSF